MKFKLIYNPFERIAGSPALMSGLGIMIITAFIASFSGTHFDGLLDFHIGNRYPFFVFLVEIAINWITISFVFYASGLLLSKSRIRVIDVFGTQAMARYPFLFAAPLGFFGFFRDIDLSNIPRLVLIGTFSIFFVIWYVAIMFHAYRIACNLRGNRLIFSFIFGVLMAEVISKIAIVYFLKQIIQTNPI